MSGKRGAAQSATTGARKNLDRHPNYTLTALHVLRHMTEPATHTRPGGARYCRIASIPRTHAYALIGMLTRDLRQLIRRYLELAHDLLRDSRSGCNELILECVGPQNADGRAERSRCVVNMARAALSHRICTGIPQQELGHLIGELAGP